MFGVPAHAGEAAGGNRVAVEQSESGTCALLQRAISRRACLARLERRAPIDTAENK
jgi:hypothetical protein